MEINFIANDIVYEVTEDDSFLIGFADDKMVRNQSLWLNFFKV